MAEAPLAAYLRPNRLDAGAEPVDIEALLGHENFATTDIDTHGGQARMEQGERGGESAHSAAIEVESCNAARTSARTAQLLTARAVSGSIPRTSRKTIIDSGPKIRANAAQSRS